MPEVLHQRIVSAVITEQYDLVAAIVGHFSNRLLGFAGVSDPSAAARRNGSLRRQETLSQESVTTSNQDPARLDTQFFGVVSASRSPTANWMPSRKCRRIGAFHQMCGLWPSAE